MIPRLYRVLCRLFPPDFRESYGDEVAEVFRQLWQEAPGVRRRLRVAARSFARLPLALAADWWSYWTEPDRRRSRRTHRSLSMMEWPRHVRYAIRTLVKTPSFTWSAVLLVGLGVGAVTTIFTLVDHILLRPLPYPDSERLITVEEGSHSGPLFREMQQLSGVELWGAGYDQDVNLTGEGSPQRLLEARVSRDFFTVLGADAVRGRLLGEDDFAAASAIVVSGGTWRRVWGGDPDLVGRTVTVDGQPATVIGILDQSFQSPEAIVGRDVDLWRPIDWSDPGFSSHERWQLQVVGRLRSGSVVPSVQAEMDGLMDRMALVHDNYRTLDESGPRYLPVRRLEDATVEGVRAGLGLLMGAVALLLLVACANVAHLFLARGLGRHREMAIRRALGADTGTLVRQLMVESALVGLAGGLVGLLIAMAGLRAFLALNPTALPREAAVGLDPRVLGFALLTSLATAFVFGLLPALKAVRRDVGRELRGTTRTSTLGRGVSAMRSGLVVAEVALSLVLVASAGLLLRSFITVQTQDPGFELAHVWTIPLTPREVATPEEYRLAMEEIRSALMTVPGVQSAGYGLTVPLEMTGGRRCCWRSTVRTEDESAEFGPWLHPVSEGFFQTFSIPVLYGAVWPPADAGSQPAPAVISEGMAMEMFGDARAAIGQRLSMNSADMIVVGVSGNTRHYGLDADPDDALYLPIESLPFTIPLAHIAVKVTPGASAGVGRRLREAVWAASPNLPVPVVRSMDEWLRLGTASRRFDSALFGSFGIVALLLAAGGLYGTLLYVAGQRRRELAIRLALGASKRTIERRVLQGGVAVAVLGVALGLGGSWATARFLESRLWGVERSDPLALSGAAALLLLTALLASWLPARRAARTDPLETLKAE